MAATIARFRDHDLTALAAWNGGEGRNTKTCKHKVGVPDENGGPPLSRSDTVNHILTRSLLAQNRSWSWGPRHDQLSGPVWFRSNGELESPWGFGTWGTVAGPWRRDAVPRVRSGRNAGEERAKRGNPLTSAADECS